METDPDVPDGCVVWGSKVVMAERGRTMLLHDLHEGHPGIVRMKSLLQAIFDGQDWMPI